MKRLLAVVALFGAMAYSFGQGYVNFNNTTATRASTNGLLITAAPVPSWYYALLVAPSTQNTVDPSLSGWTFVALGTNTTLAGRMAGNTTADNGGVPIAGYTGTSTADFVVVAWSANLGSDWVAIFAGRPIILTDNTHTGRGFWLTPTPMYGWYGISTVGNNILLAPSGGPYNSVWGTANSGLIQGINLNCYWVPEPSTFALAGLGAAALLVFRRRR